MSAEGLLELLGTIDRHRALLNELFDYSAEFRLRKIDEAPWEKSTGLAAAGLLENYYTCAETIFLRISQFFENHLPKDRWHTDLLEKMTIHIEATRPRVLTEDSAVLLTELLRFRHFKRYYFQLDLDRDKIRYLFSVMERLHPALHRDLDTFTQHLRAI